MVGAIAFRVLMGMPLTGILASLAALHLQRREQSLL